MERPHHSTKYAWAAIGSFVLAWDVLAPETLSHGVDRALEHSPVARAAALGGIAITAAHLANLLPEQIDPFTRIPRRLGSVKE